MEGERIIEPLLYIDQPVLQKPKAYMQDHYQTMKIKKEEKLTTASSQKEKNTDKENDSFKDLTVKEKIKYLVNLPSEVPKIRCEIVTEDKRYRGIVLEENDDEVVLRIFGRENATVKKEKILSINMIGF